LERYSLFTTSVEPCTCDFTHQFGAFFFQTYWSIMKEDVINAVLQFFSTGWMLPSYNTNIIVMIPKALNADTVNQFRPIALANFMFKNVCKILADILAIIMPRLISHEHKGFIRGRNIKDCICTTYEAINLLHKKPFGGNITFKIDISKAFDTSD